MADDERPADLEVKDTRGTLLGYQPSTVPHISRTGSQLTEDERDIADRRLRDNEATSVSEEDHNRAQFHPFGQTTESGGKQTSTGKRGVALGGNQENDNDAKVPGARVSGGSAKSSTTGGSAPSGDTSKGSDGAKANSDDSSDDSDSGSSSTSGAKSTGSTRSTRSKAASGSSS